MAVKVLKSDYRSDEIFIQKFLSEAQAAAGLMHPNVVNVYDVGQDRGLYYMVMELVEGITLKDYIEKKGQLSANETISISIQMATGIQAAHDQHIIHRDIKPQNIIISIDGKVKVTDFGIARATTSTQTISTNVMGSVHYTSPEHAKGGNVDEKSDIYSAGITMYEMITGHVPFDGDSTVSVAIKHLQEEIPSPVKEVPEIPYSLECIILKCTQKNAERRYQNCQELIMDLKRSLVDPEGDFVNNPEYIPGGDETIMMSDEDKRRIQNRNNYQQDYYEEEEDYGGGYGDDGYGDDEYDDYEDDYERSRGNGDGSGSVVGTVLKVVVTLAIIVIAAVIIFMVVKSEGFFDKMSIDSPIKEEEETKQVSVPYLIGLTEDEAKDALSKEGLGYGVSKREQSDEFERGQIISQSPEADQKVDVNTEILVSVSIGKAIEKKKVPEVAGQDEAAAKNMMANSGFVVEVEQREDDNVPAGKVITTAPAGGVEVVEGTKIILYVSKGSNKVTVPPLKDMTKEQAANLLASMELTGSVSGEEFSDDVEEGKIISQSPAAGEKVPKNTAITYVVSKGKEDKDDDKDPDRPGYPGSSGGDMPNVKGMEAGYAMSILDSYGYPASIVGYETNSTMISGYVISQTLYDDGTVGLVVSQD